MTISLSRPIRLSCALALGTLAGLPAAALATGGAPAPGTPGPVGAPTEADPSAPAITSITAAALPPLVADGQIALVASSATPVRRSVRFVGRAPQSAVGKPVAIERFDDESATWVPTAQATVAPNGTFGALWKTRSSGRFRTRALIAGAAPAVSAELPMTIYRPALATYYGPGLWGRKTACGLKLTKAVQGVAHRTLPCGTQVAVVYRGRQIVVPVIDRGPFRHGTTWDLTGATAKALAFKSTARIGGTAMRELPPVATPAKAPPARSSKKSKRR